MILGEFIETIGISETEKFPVSYESGSSISTSLMSGIIALYLSKNKDMNKDDINEAYNVNKIFEEDGF